MKNQYDWWVWEGYRALAWNISKAEYVWLQAIAHIDRLVESWYKVRHLLDIWCGSGVWTNRMIERYNPTKVIGIDASEEQIVAASDWVFDGADTRFIQEDMRQMSEIVTEMRYDLVTAFVSLHYLRLEELMEVLKKIHGMIYVWWHIVATINNPFKPEWWSELLGARSYFSHDTNRNIQQNNQLIEVDLFDSEWEYVTSLKGVYHHTSEAWKWALEQAWFGEVTFFWENDSLICIAAKKMS